MTFRKALPYLIGALFVLTTVEAMFIPMYQSAKVEVGNQYSPVLSWLNWLLALASANALLMLGVRVLVGFGQMIGHFVSTWNKSIK